MTAPACLFLLLFPLAFAVQGAPDLQRVKAEPNPEKRSQMALDNAREALKTARAAYDKGETDLAAKAIDEIQQSVELSYESLTGTGKDPRKSPKWFKKAEMDIRELLRRLESFQQAMSFSDRSIADQAKASLQQVHERLLMGLMEGKHK